MRSARAKKARGLVAAQAASSERSLPTHGAEGESWQYLDMRTKFSHGAVLQYVQCLLLEQAFEAFPRNSSTCEEATSFGQLLAIFIHTDIALWLQQCTHCSNGSARVLQTAQILFQHKLKVSSQTKIRELAFRHTTKLIATNSNIPASATK